MSAADPGWRYENRLLPMPNRDSIAQTVYLIRHAHAFKRMEWTEPDHLRPLTKKGRRQAEGIARQLAPEPIDAIWSSPAIRCVRTVEPLANTLGLEVEVRQDVMEGRAIVLPSEPRVLAICGHGDNIPNLIDALGVMCDECRKASIWRVDFEPDRRIAAARYIKPPDVDGRRATPPVAPPDSR